MINIEQPVTMADLMAELRKLGKWITFTPFGRSTNQHISLLDYKLSNGLKDIEYQIKLQRGVVFDDNKTWNAPPTPNDKELKFQFPIKTPEDLNYFLVCLNEDQYKDAMVSDRKDFLAVMVRNKYFVLQLARCKRLGGTTSAKMVRNIWKFLFSPGIQKLLNWSGQNDKIRIDNSRLFSVVEGWSPHSFNRIKHSQTNKGKISFFFVSKQVQHLKHSHRLHWTKCRT